MQASLLAEDGQGSPAGQSLTRISTRTNGDHDASGVSNRTGRKVSQHMAVYCATHINGPTSVNYFGSSLGLGQILSLPARPGAQWVSRGELGGGPEGESILTRRPLDWLETQPRGAGEPASECKPVACTRTPACELA